jgi:hypothetical protein
VAAGAQRLAGNLPPHTREFSAVAVIGSRSEAAYLARLRERMRDATGILPRKRNHGVDPDRDRGRSLPLDGTSDARCRASRAPSG